MRRPSGQSWALASIMGHSGNVEYGEWREEAIPPVITCSVAGWAGRRVRSAIVCLVMGKRTDYLNSDWEVY